MRRALNLIGVSQQVSQRTATSSASQPGYADAAHYRLVEQMLSGTADEIVSQNSDVMVTERITAAGGIASPCSRAASSTTAATAALPT